jgi:hypothetical protein
LTGLPVERCRGRNKDYHSSLAIIADRRSLRHMGQALAYEINSSPNVDIHDEIKIFKVERVTITIEDLKVLLD